MNIGNLWSCTASLLTSVVATVMLTGCGLEDSAMPAATEATASADFARGPNNGRLLAEDEFSVELAIFEAGVPPEYRAWATWQGTQVRPQDVELVVTLTRLDNEINVINFMPQGDVLRGDMVIYEPHSFAVQVLARHQDQIYEWQFDSFEGRTSINPELSALLGIETAIAGPAVLQQQVEVTGSITANRDFSRAIHARFDGPVQSVAVSLGETVAEGDPLLVIESNESLKPYMVYAPIAGVVTTRNVNPGEQSAGRMLMEIADTSQVWAELAVFPADRAAVEPGATVAITPVGGGASVTGVIAGFAPELGAGQTVTARVRVDNADGRFAPGTFVSASIDTGAIDVPLAVRREGLQAFRDFTVVFAKIGNEYEVRMLELGRQDAEMIEVLGGLAPGTEYVTTNSYIIKADVEKSGASHDH